MVSVLVNPEADEPCRLVLQFLQRLGSFLKFLSWKNNCSPAVNTKSAPQSTHLRTLSWNSILRDAPSCFTPMIRQMGHVSSQIGVSSTTGSAHAASRVY